MWKVKVSDSNGRFFRRRQSRSPILHLMETVDDREWAARGKTLVQVVITVITVIGIIIAIMNIFFHCPHIVYYQEWLEEEGQENISSIINRNGTFNATSPALVCFISLFAWNISVIFNFRLHSVSQNSDTIKFRYQPFQLTLPTPALSSSGWKLKCFESHIFLTF